MRWSSTAALACSLLLILGMGSSRPPAPTEDQYQRKRTELVEEIREDVRQVSRGIDSPAARETLADPVMEAMARVPRHEFVPENQKRHAYENRPLPIGYGQTISQPYIVALMTDLLGVGKGARVLELGTGSGYQAAVLAEIVDQVYTIEIIKELGDPATELLARLGYDNVQVRIGDGYYGWEDQAPFDGIIVTAAATHIPPPLVRQLKPGARMVIPVGDPFMTQQLTLVEKTADGRTRTQDVLPVLFVPLTGGHD